MTKRAAIECRVSTRNQADFGTSLDTQERLAREFAVNAGYEVVEALVVREDHTGVDLNRPGLERLKQAAAAGQFDVLIIHSYDRFHRPENPGDEWKGLELMAFFKEHGVVTEFVDGAVPTDGPYASVFSILAGVNAGDYRRKMLEATHRGTIA